VEPLARGSVRGERFCLASCTVERPHQLAAEALSEGVLPDERLELRNELGVTTCPEVGLEPLLDRLHT
jgi:hypothetical protein